MGLFGVVLTIRPGSELFSLIALMPLVAAVRYASSGVVVRLVDVSVPIEVLNLYSQTGALVGAIVLMLGTSGVYFSTQSYRLTEPSNIAPFGYFSIPFSFLLGWIFFDETPFSALFPGVFFIILSGIVIIWRDHTIKPEANE